MKSRGSLVVFVLFGLVALAGCLSLFRMHSFAADRQAQGNPFFPPEMNAARDAKTAFVVGDLGGVPVKIPDYFANYVEYDGDPGFGERRRGARPQRTYQSKLASFGFEVRFPDMAGRSTPELWKDYERYNGPEWKFWQDPEKSTPPWIHVGILTNSAYPKDGFLDRGVKYLLEFNAQREGFKNLAHQNYERLPDKEYGLTAYAPPGIDVKTGKPYRQYADAYDLFVGWKEDGKVGTYIKCRNSENPANSLCMQYFSMEPSMQAEIYIQYPRYCLRHWMEFQKSVGDLLWSFKHVKTSG